MTETLEPPADTKDWTWVLQRPCPECGFSAADLPGHEVAGAVRAAAARLVARLEAADAGERPVPTVWSPVEYACHVRDVCRVFGERLGRMLEEETPTFANWDQDATALEDGYHLQAADQVAGELGVAAEQLAGQWEEVPAGAWDRAGHRSNGSAFTVLTLGQYLVHDLVHHVHDVGA